MQELSARSVKPAGSIAARLGRVEWAEAAHALEERGWATTPPLLTAAECAELARLYSDERRFRSRVDMARFRFGEGEYKYFANPLPSVVGELRRHAYPRLAPIASAWEKALGGERRYPPELDDFLAICAEHGQTKPTPLLLRYEVGGYNCLHQDLYGDVAFPLQMTCLLSRPGQDFTGGEFLLVEQRPRAQSRGTATLLPHGHGFVFTTRERPVESTRGWSASPVRHGVSAVRSGQRFTLGLVFHDAA
jgi:uncharacterized protein